MPGKNALLNLITSQGDDTSQESGAVKRALEVIRSHLGMNVAYVSEFVDGRSVFREVDAPGLEEMVKVGNSHSLDDVYCRHILEGRLPEIIPDTLANPITAAMPITSAAHIGSHMSVPIRLEDGSAYGMFCCLGFEANNSLNERDLSMMKAFAELAAFEIGREVDAKRDTEEKLVRIKDVIENEKISIVFQPIWDIAAHKAVGLECLSRFAATPQRSPDKWFNEAAEAGLGVELEMAAIGMALAAFASLPPHTYLAINASPDTILSAGFTESFSDVPLDRLVLEVTEHAHVENYDLLLNVIQPLRVRGMRLAVDDAGAGYSSLQHILHLRPDIIKLDMTLTRHVDLDPARGALAAALIKFAAETGSKIVAEGVETASELKTLATLGAEMAQGYYLARPMPLAQAIALFNDGSAAKARVA